MGPPLAQRWRLLLALCIIVLGVGIGAALRARSVRASLGAAKPARLPPFAIIYSRESEPPDFREIIWQRGADENTGRVLYRSQGSSAPHEIPSDFGYLPSPTGTWVFVWETEWRSKPRGHCTEWWLVRVADGKRYPMGKVAGVSGVAPHWYGGSDVWLDLVKGREKWQVDLRGETPKLSKPLPAGAERRRDVDGSGPQAAAWRRAFVQDNFGADRLAAQKLLKEHGEELGLSEYFLRRVSHEPDTLEDMLLRPMQIVDVGGLNTDKFNWPELSVSPTGKQVARSRVAQAGNRRLQARLDVYEVSSGLRLWGKELRWPAMAAGQEGEAPFLTGERALMYLEQPIFRHLRWSPDGSFLSYSEVALRNEGDRAIIVDAASGAEVTRLREGTDAFVVPVPGEKEGKPVIPCACTQREHK